ncbi:MAG: hypothetical protein HRF40_03915 [Nitrososphaera sp.]|jgi:uncharacterized membrane protein
MQTEKPAGVDLLAIIMLINGIFAFFSGLDRLYFASFLATSIPINTSVPGIAEATAQYVAIWGAIILAIGIGSFLVAFGLFRGRGWGWSGAMALAIIGIVIPIMNFAVGYWPSIFTILLSALVIYYLTRREVRVYFGKEISSQSDADAAAA